MTQEETARNEIEAKFMATSNTLKDTQSAFDTERTLKDQEITQLKDEVNNNKCSPQISTVEIIKQSKLHVFKKVLIIGVSYSFSCYSFGTTCTIITHLTRVIISLFTKNICHGVHVHSCIQSTVNGIYTVCVLLVQCTCTLYT